MNLIAFATIMFSATCINNTKAYAATTERIYGQDRYETSISISQKGWSQSKYAIIANGENFPDALSSIPLAAKYDAPILLVDANNLRNDVSSELKRLNVEEVFIVGGKGVVSDTVKTQLENMNIKTNRIAGEDRIGTSLEVAKSLGDFNQVVITNGYGFADALSIAPIAAKKGIPILLSNADGLDDNVKQYLKDKNITNTYVVGGPGVLKPSAIEGLSNPERLYGQDRYATNVAVLNRFSTELNLNTVYIASGQNFPDALAGSALASKTSSPIVLCDNVISNSTYDFLNTKMNSINNLSILGGEGVVSPANLEDINFKSDTSSNGGNIVNAGFSARQGDYIYYKGQEDGFIWRSNIDGSNSTKINSEDSYYINVVGDWIYYTGENENLYKIKVDGTNRTALNNKQSHFITVVGDWIYYLDTTGNSAICRMKTDGTGNEVIKNANVVDMNVTADAIYYVNAQDFCIYKIDLNNGFNQNKVSDDKASFIATSGEWIYYTNSSDKGTVYKIKTDGTYRTKLTDDSAVDINIQGQYIYYSNYQDNQSIYRIMLDGSDKKKINNNKSIFLNIVGGWIYYVNADSNELYKIRIDGNFEQRIQ